MYGRNGTLSLVTNASSIGNNLAVQFEPQKKTAHTVAVIHEGYINVIPVCSSEKRARYIPCVESGTRPKHVNTSVTQVMWYSGRRLQLFVVASSLGVQIFDEDGKVCKFSHPCADSSNVCSSFARGLALIAHNALCVGNSSGSINIFNISEDTDEVAHVDCKRIHKKAITDIATSLASNLLVSADDSGALSAWKMEHDLKPVYEFGTFGARCLQELLQFAVATSPYVAGRLQLVYRIALHALPPFSGCVAGAFGTVVNIIFVICVDP